MGGASAFGLIRLNRDHLEEDNCRSKQREIKGSIDYLPSKMQIPSWAQLSCQSADFMAFNNGQPLINDLSRWKVELMNAFN